MIFFGDSAGIALKLEKAGPTCSSFSPCPSFLSNDTDDMK